MTYSELFAFCTIISVAVFAQSPDSPPPSVIGQRNPNAIKGSAKTAQEEIVIRNPGVPVASVSSVKITNTSEQNVNPAESSPVATTAAADGASDAAAGTDYTPLGQTGAGITLEGAWNTLLQSSQPKQQPDPVPAPISQPQPDPFDIFGPLSNNLFDMGPPSSGSGGRGPSQGPGPDMGMGSGFGGMPLAALAMMGGGLGEGLGSMGSSNMVRLLAGSGGLGFGSGGELFGGMGGGQGGGGGMFGSGSGAGPQMDLMRTMLLLQVLGGDAPDPPAPGKRKPGAPGSRGRPASPLEQLMRLERIRMLRSQQMERAMRNRNAPQNQGIRFEFQGRSRPGPGGPPNRNRRPGRGRGRRWIRPNAPSSAADMPEPTPTTGTAGPESSSAGPAQDGLSPADATLRDKLLQVIGQMGLGKPNMNDLWPPSPTQPSRGMGQRPRGRGPPFGRRGPSFSRGRPGDMGSTPSGEMGPPYMGGEMGPTNMGGELGPTSASGEIGPNFPGGEIGPSGSGEMGPGPYPRDGMGPSGSGEMGPGPYPSGGMAPSGEIRPTVSTNMRQNMMSDTHFQRSMRVGSRPRLSAVGGSGANAADRQADRADLIADYMDNMQAQSPLQRLVGHGGTMPGAGLSGMPGLGSGFGTGGGLSSLAGLLGSGGGGMGNLGLAALLG